MPDADPKYVRVYYSVVNDERFSTVYHDARHLGTWLQLLLVADAMYPADAPLPAYVNRASVKVLVDCGLIEARMHQHYRMHGLASEREKRSQSGRNAAAMRWQSERIADPMPRRAEQRQDKTSRDEQGPSGETDALAWLATHNATLAPNGNGLHTKVCRLVETHGVPAVIRAFEELAADGRATEPRQYILGADDILNPLPSTRRNGHQSHDYLPSVEEAENAFEHYE